MVISEIRKAYIDKYPNLKIYDMSVPNDIDATQSHITIDGQVMKETENYKFGNEWNVSITLNFWFVNKKGFVSSKAIEDVLEQFINDDDLNINGCKLQHREMFECKQWANLETDAETIQRYTLIFRHWVS